MTSKLTRYIIQSKIADFFAGVVEIHTKLGGPNTAEEAQNQLTERVLACVPVVDSEPYGFTDGDRRGMIYEPQYADRLNKPIPVYRHAQQPVVPPMQHWEELCREYPDMSIGDAIIRAAWWNHCRAAMLQAGNCRENANSSTNNCREIAETSTGTAITPAAPDKKLTDDVLDEIIAGAKTSMEQYLALSLKAEREVWRKEGPTDDERIMAIEGIHNCERCGDEGWVVGEMGIMRCACGQAGTLINEDTIQAGNPPVITGAEQRIADAVELLQKAAPAMLADNSGPDGPLAGTPAAPPCSRLAAM